MKQRTKRKCIEEKRIVTKPLPGQIHDKREKGKPRRFQNEEEIDPWPQVRSVRRR